MKVSCNTDITTIRAATMQIAKPAVTTSGKNMTEGGFCCDRTKTVLTRLVLLPGPKEGDRFIWREKKRWEESQTSCTSVSWMRSWPGTAGWRTEGREWGRVRTRLICGWISGHSLHAQRNHFTSKNSKESLPQDTGVDIGSDKYSITMNYIYHW